MADVGIVNRAARIIAGELAAIKAHVLALEVQRESLLPAPRQTYQPMIHEVVLRVGPVGVDCYAREGIAETKLGRFAHEGVAVAAAVEFFIDRSSLLPELKRIPPFRVLVERTEAQAPNGAVIWAFRPGLRARAGEGSGRRWVRLPFWQDRPWLQRRGSRLAPAAG